MPSNAEEAEVEWFYEDFLELTPKKDVLFVIGDWNAKLGSQEIPGVTGKFGLGVQNEAGQRPTEFYQENTLVIANTLFQQHKRWLYIEISPDAQYWNHIDYILCSQIWRSSMQPAKIRLGADCGSDHELLIAKLRLKLKKVWKTTRTLSYRTLSYKKESESEVTQLCLTLCDPLDCSPPCSSIHGIIQARVLEWVAISFSRGSFRLRDWIQVSRIVGRCFTVEPPDIKVWPKSNPLWLYSGGDQYIQGIRPGSLSVWRTMDGGL